MSELTNSQCSIQALRWKLLATVSALALLGTSIDVAQAANDDADRPVVWIELGGQLNRLEDGGERFVPPFVAANLRAGFASPLALEKPPLYSLSESGKISFQPEGSDWVFSASIRYGRSEDKRYHDQQTDNPPVGLGAVGTGAKHRYAETTTGSSETHEISDFMAGKDIGLGALGTNGTSVLSGGLRFAQFQSRSSTSLYSDPDYSHPDMTTSVAGPKYFHNFGAVSHNEKSFTGVGPAISWDASTSLNGHTPNGQLTFDWGLNAAVLFGRQKSVGYHQTKGKLSTGYISLPQIGKYFHTTHYTHGLSHNRSRMVAVPNVGATAGLSFRYANAKVSFGYRVDEFFGAMDGGLDTRKSYNQEFYGPFATISIGLR